MWPIVCMYRILRSAAALLLLLCVAPAFSQTAVQYDTVSVYLSGQESDTIVVHLPDRYGGALSFDTTGTGTSKLAKPKQRVFLPFYMGVVIDTLERTASADVDSFAMAWTPLNPLTKANLTAHKSYVIGTASVAVAAISEVTIYDLPLTAYSGDYALIVRQDDLGTPILKIVFVFMRIS